MLGLASDVTVRHWIAKTPGVVVLEGLHHLRAGVHDERPGPRDRLSDRRAAKDDDIQTCRMARLLRPGGRQPQRITCLLYTSDAADE